MPKKGSRKDIQSGIRQKVRQALLTVAPSEAEAVIAEVLGEGVVIPAIGKLAEDLIGGQIINRAGMYPESAFATYENNVMMREGDEGVTLGRRVLEHGDNCEDCIAAATEEFVPLDELAEIGDSVCQSRCRCEFEFQIGDVQFATSELFSATISGQEAFGGDVDIS
jgi:hypothetical protein